MIIKNANEQEIWHALDETNREFDYNLDIFKLQRKSKNILLVRLKVKNSKAVGARFSPWSKRRTAFACWHAHGRFFENLFMINPRAEIRTSWATYKGYCSWENCDVGYLHNPVKFSEVCNCQW